MILEMQLGLATHFLYSDDTAAAMHNAEPRQREENG